jgi:integrase
MMQPDPTAPRGALIVTRRKSGDRAPQWEACWRDSTGKRIKRRLGQAFLAERAQRLAEPSGWAATWEEPRAANGRHRPCPPGLLSASGAAALMAQLIAEREEDLASGNAEKRHAAEREAASLTLEFLIPQWLVYAKDVKAMTPQTLRAYGYDLASLAAAPEFRQVPPGARPPRGTSDKELRTWATQWPAKPANAITARDVEEWRDRLLRSGRLTGRTINKKRQVLSSVLGWAAKSHRFPVITANIVLEVEKITENPPGEIDFYEPEELLSVATIIREGRHRTDRMPRGGIYSRADAKALREADDRQDTVLVFTLAFAGLRLGEARALRWRDISFTRNQITVNRAVSDGIELPFPKGKKPRTLPLIPDLAAALRELRKREHFRDRDDLVFVGGAGDHVDQSAFRRRFKRACKAAGLRPLRVHDLRHGFVSLAAQEFPAHRLQALAGHADPRTTARYTHAKARPDDLDRLERAFGQGEAS